MFVAFEVSGPLQLKPGLLRNKTIVRFWWLWFAISYHPMKLNEMVEMANRGEIIWK